MKKKLSLTHPQYDALSAIYGPPTSVHFMIMTSDFQDNRVILEGSDDAFEDLISVAVEEIHEGFCSQTRAKLLMQICRKIDRSSVDFLFC